MKKGESGLFLKVTELVDCMRGQVPHLGDWHLKEPPSSVSDENLALVNSFFMFFGCLWLLSSLNRLFISVMVELVPVLKSSLVLLKMFGLLGLWVVMKGRIFFGGWEDFFRLGSDV